MHYLCSSPWPIPHTSLEIKMKENKSETVDFIVTWPFLCFSLPLLLFPPLFLPVPSSQEKQDKATLLAEMANLRQNNQRLQDESHSASEQLRKFSKLLSSTMPERK